MPDQDQRKTMIIEEINYWKEHKLLPAFYCDFLLALYTNGKGQIKEPTKDSVKLKSSSSILLLLLSLLVPLSFIVVYFTPLHALLQLTILFVCFGLALWMFLYFKKNKNKLYHLVRIIVLMFILLSTILISDIFISHELGRKFVILINFIGWALIGYKNKLKYLMIISVLAIIIMSYYIIF